MGTRTLICTFGFTRRRVLAAMRHIAYDRLVIVAGKDVISCSELGVLVDLESKSGGTVETLSVDAFDFADCRNTIDEAIHAALEKGEAVVNISGGTKVLGDAALFAAFENGVEAYHCDETVIKLPVLKGVKFIDALGPGDIKVLEELREGDTSSDLRERMAGEDISEPMLFRSIWNLKRLGIIEASLKNGRAVLHRVAAHKGLLASAGPGRASRHG